MRTRYGLVDTEYVARLATTAPTADGPILMVNFMRYRERADYSGIGDAPPVTGREADDLYAPVDVLADIGAEICFVGDVIDSSSAHDGERWDRMAIVRYPTRRSFVEMQSRKDFQAKHVHKDAGMEFTIVLGALPPAGATLPPRSTAPNVRFDLVDRPRAAVSSALELEVEGVVVGDDRRWPVLCVSRIATRETVSGGGVSMSVVARSGLDRLTEVVDRWPHTELAG